MLEPKVTLTADPAEILRHLQHITRRWSELPDAAPILEIVYLSAADRAEVKHVGHYRPADLAEAAADVAGMNTHKINAYCVVNPLDGHNMPRANGRANRENILAAFFNWADADDAQAAENIRHFVGPKCTFHVLTGTTPSLRPHVYWELEQPAIGRSALDEWEQVQKSIAATLKTDSSVTDSPRIMRLAGTVNWPKPQKLAKGYIPELTTLRIYDPTERPPVASERMQRAFAGQQPSLSQQATPQGPGSFEIDTGGGAGMGQAARDERIAAILRGDNWHKNVVSVVGSYVGRGFDDSEIHRITDTFTLPGYTITDTRKEVQEAIDGARRKGWTPDPQTSMMRDLTPQEIEAIPAALFRPWVEKDLTAIPYPRFVYSDFYARGYTSVTLAPPKVGKSMMGLAEAIDIATGRGFLTGIEREPQRVVYFNAEDDQDVIDSRVAALLTHYDIPQSEIIGRLFATSGVDMADFYMVSGQEGIINETLFVSIEKFIREENADALIFDPLQDLSRSPETNEVFRMLGQRLRRMASSTGVALGLIHHTRKIAPGTTPTIDDGRGGSALRGTARFNRLLIGMTKDEGAKAGVINHRHYLRVGDMESNLAPPSADLNRWFEKTSVITPNGHSVGAIKPWKWPDAFDGFSRQDSAKVRSAFASMVEPPRENIRSAAWAGVVIGDILGIDVTDTAGKSKVQSMLTKWISTDVLRVETVHDARNGRTAKVVVAGENNPMTEISQ